MNHSQWMAIGKLLAALTAAAFLVSLVNCSGNPPVQPSGMTVIDHSNQRVITTQQEKQPCE
jgi:hypothetical protein